MSARSGRPSVDDGTGRLGRWLAANFGININDAGARLSQAFGFAMVLYGAINLTFGGWIPGLFPGTLALGLLLEALFPAVCFYGAYLRATVID